MTERRSEREAKFEVQDDFEMPFLGTPIERSSVKLSARYWDSADHRLLRWGQTLRYRHASDGSEDGWTLKVGPPPGAPASGAVLDRQELDDPGLRATSRMDVLVGYALARSVVRLIGEDPKIRAGSDADPVHDARVATRRLRSDLKSLEPFLAPVERLRTELGWVGGLLGAVRDLDVLIERMDTRIRELDGPDREAAAPILAHLEDDRRRRRTELRDGLGSDRYLTLLDELVEASRRPPVADPTDERRARRALRTVTRQAWRRTARAGDRLGPKSPDV